jgi:predicted transcriptional regulator
MQLARVHQQLMTKEQLQRAVAGLHQPVTAVELARREGINLDRAGYLLWDLARHGLVRCLNGSARQSRVYWLTDRGGRVQRYARAQLKLPRLRHGFPQVDWGTYGWACYRHRSAIIKALERPLRPVHIKRRARQRDDHLRMSANNVRDAIKLLLERGIVRKVTVSREPHPSYELTEDGRAIRTLLLWAASA